MREPTAPWQVVLPVRGGRSAKTRLRGGWPIGHDPALADAVVAALAADSLHTVLACELVHRAVVVAADDESAARASAAGATVVTESRPGAGLLAAIADGVAVISTVPNTAAGPSGPPVHPGPVAVLLADVPAARPADLTVALTTATNVLWRSAPSAMVALSDAEGEGTVLLAARGFAALRPAFGPGSFAAHLRLGAVPLPVTLPRLQRDVDTVADLAQARALGLGRHTAAALAATERQLPVA